MPSSIVYPAYSGSLSNTLLPSGSAQVLMGWIKRSTPGPVSSDSFAFGLIKSNAIAGPGETDGNWGLSFGTSSANHYVRLVFTYWDSVTQSIDSSTDWYFAVLQRASGSAVGNLRLFKDDGPTFTKVVDLTRQGGSSTRQASRISIYGDNSNYQLTGLKYFTGSTFTDAQCREQATYRFPSTHPTASLYDYWILETATQLTGSVTGTLLSGSTPILSQSSAPLSIRPAQRLRYVNTNSTSGGDGTTLSTTGASRAYPSLYAAFVTQSNGANNTLLTTDQYLEIQCSGGTDISTINPLYFQMTTDSTRYVLLTAAPGQEASIPIDMNKYVFSGSFDVFSCTSTIIKNLQFDNSSSTTGGTVLSFSGFGQNSDTCRAVFSGNTVRQRGIGAGLVIAPRLSGSHITAVNNFITASTGVSGSVYAFQSNTTSANDLTQSFYNNTVVGGRDGYFLTFYGGRDTINFKNNLGIGSSTRCFGLESTPSSQSFENNASSDNTAFANTIGGATLRNRTFTFRNSQSGDYRLRGDDVGARKLGVNLSSDSYYPFTTDFFGQDRNRNGWWDIGADQADIGYGGVTGTTIFIDEFNRSDSGSLGSNYDSVVSASSLVVFNNTVRGQGGVACANAIKSTVKQFSPTQEATIRYTALQIADLGGPAVRLDTTAGTGYFVQADGGNFSERRLHRLVTGSAVRIGNVNIVPTPGDTVTIRASGSLISVLLNGRVIDSSSDASYPTGQPGMYYFWSNEGGTRLDNFIASDISTTGGSLAVMTNTGSRGLVVGVT